MNNRVKALFPFRITISYLKRQGRAMCVAGIVKWFSEKKGFGFIQPEEGEDVFVHFSSIQGEGYRTLNQGDRVQFEVETGPKGLHARNVMKLS